MSTPEKSPSRLSEAGVILKDSLDQNPGGDMRRKQQYDNNEDGQDTYGQMAGAIGVLVIAFGILAAIKDKLGLSWPATVLLTAGALVALGYLAWRAKTWVKRRWADDGESAAALKQEAPAQAEQAAVAAAPVHSELTAALVRAGAIGRDEVILLSDVRTEVLPGVGTQYVFLVPEARTHEDVAKRLGPIASMLGVTRLHLKLETSRHTEREVRLLKLNEPPFSRLFDPPSKREIREFDGIPLGHDVTGALGGVPTFDKASMLIGGMTQMGKTTLVNGLITCLLIAYGSDFDLYLLDGKLCGLTKFEKIAVRYEASDDPAVMESMLDDLLSRVDGRYTRMQEAIRNRKPSPEFRRVFFIVDEAADFYTDNGTKESKEQVRRVEDKSRSLVAKSLESGICAVMLTQRPANNAIPVKVRDQFLYRMCLYVASEGGAKVALGDSYFDTIAPIHPALLDASVKGQAVLFANGTSTLLRGFNFPDEFIWEVVDEVAAGRRVEFEKVPVSPLRQAIDLMQSHGVEFMPTAELAPLLGITETDPTSRGKQLNRLLGVAADKGAQGVRGYRLADLTAAALSGS
ncbi:FtsK/SpoIIIE domain-containing protein [Streptomyces olivoreticuli]|uniref:FtsK/SpoIIIE domain-containing protein n=1 Tax=Streptomyces olivoreticuli TaxID=68246 RepID=UPI0026596E65|nr:FtsK/SpoIIIE domain-containing protein [Streptomyces olivoreticuli]WKK24131.1 FtsK/SpoIIIE domain-containing protein [Streptomyces olivoreticuli]